MKNTQICIDCGSKSTQEDHFNIMKVSNETNEFSHKKTVRLQIVYIYDYDKFKKYVVSLSPGEYTYWEVINQIKSKVEIDRMQIKL